MRATDATQMVAGLLAGLGGVRWSTMNSPMSGSDGLMVRALSMIAEAPGDDRAFEGAGHGVGKGYGAGLVERFETAMHVTEHVVKRRRCT